MRKAYWIALLLAGTLLECTSPYASLEKEYELDAAYTLRLSPPDAQEYLLGDQLELNALVRVTDGANLPVSVPEHTYQFTVNGQSSRSSTFSATAPGTYEVKVRIGTRTSNSFTIAVLPYTLVRIPVVFHTVNSSLSQAQIDRLVKGMTEAYRNRWNPSGGAKDENAVDNFIEFYAAETNPSGRVLTTRGLDMVAASRQSFSSEQAVNEAWNSFWNPNRFLNVWVYAIAQKESLSGFAYLVPVTRPLAGLRVLPASRTTPDLPYGIYLNENQVNSTSSSTLAHEAGHVLGLDHVFDGNGDEHKSCSTTDPDYCADTPYYDRALYMDNYRTQRQRRVACDGTRYVSTNIMDYYLSYENSFTRQQRDRIQHTLAYGLWIPTPANSDSRSRLSAEAEYIEKPDDYRYIPPLICKAEKVD